mgnify:CR=1 FL=1
MTSRALRTSKPIDYTLLAGLVVFIVNSLFFILAYDPNIQGYEDAVRGWKQFNAILANGEPAWGNWNQIELRSQMVLFTVCQLLLLHAFGLIERPTLITYLALPMAAYLATKVKVEFALFPLAIISLDIGWKREILVIAGIAILSQWLGENNGYVIVAFRVLYLAINTIRPTLVIILSAAAVIILADQNINLVARYIPQVAVYEWTREIVNPEYSIIETLIVFLSSMVLSINPSADFPVGLPFTLLILNLTFGKEMLRKRNLLRWVNTPGFQAGVLIVLLFTSITHAFQNARYYFFYLPLLSKIGGERLNLSLLFLSIPMTYIMTVYYKFYLGM